MNTVLTIVLFICIIIASVYAYRYINLCKRTYDKQLRDIAHFEQETKDLEEQAQSLKEKIKTTEQEYMLEREKYASQKQLYKDQLDIYSAEIESKKTKILEDYNQCIANAENDYNERKGQLQNKLDALSSTLKARQEAQRREKTIKENKADYCLVLSLSEENDIRTLSELKGKLHNPRILSMLTWQTYFQKPLTALCNRVAGPTAKTGIYKITNQITDECYIGQAVDIQSRWKEHAKCGLGIDTPDGNKLYKNMLEYGLQNFSWEVLEECSKNQLDEKEAYYIDAYESKEFGLNTLAGRNVKKK